MISEADVTEDSLSIMGVTNIDPDMFGRLTDTGAVPTLIGATLPTFLYGFGWIADINGPRREI